MKLSNRLITNTILLLFTFLLYFAPCAYSEDYDLDFETLQNYIIKSEFGNAENLVQTMLKRYPDNVDLLSVLARVSAWQKKYEQAIEVCSHILKIGKPEKDIYILYLDSLIMNRNVGRAGDELAQFPQDVIDHIRATREDLIYTLKKGHVKISSDFYKYRLVKDPSADQTEFAFSVEAAQKINDFTLALNASNVTRYGLNDTNVNLDVYSMLWSNAWGYVSGSITPNAQFLPMNTFGGEIFQGYEMLEFSLGYRRMNFTSDGVNIFIPGITAYLPYNLSVNEKFYFLTNGAYTSSSVLNYEPTNKFRCFYNFTMGDGTERITSVEDIQKIFGICNRIYAEYRITDIVGIGGEFSYESRKDLYDKYGGNLFFRLFW